MNLCKSYETPEMRRQHYGKKLSGIAELYAKLVPPQYVPDAETLPVGGTVPVVL